MSLRTGTPYGSQVPFVVLATGSLVAQAPSVLRDYIYWPQGPGFKCHRTALRFSLSLCLIKSYDVCTCVKSVKKIKEYRKKVIGHRAQYSICHRAATYDLIHDKFPYKLSMMLK